MRWIWILGLVFFYSEASKAQKLEGEIEQYIEAYNLIVSDSTLINNYCEVSDQFMLAVHPHFTHHSIERFKEYLLNETTEKDYNKLLKSDNRKSEITHFTHGIAWQTISVSQNEGHWLLIDLRDKPKLIKKGFRR